MPSPFTSAITKTLPVPGDEGHSVTIRRLAPRHLEAAQKEHQRQAIAAFRELGGTSALREFKSVQEDIPAPATPAEPAPEAPADPMAGYDKITLIQKGVAEWSYAGRDPKDPEVLEDLDEERRDWLAEQVLRLARPRLFQTADEAEAEEKNGTRPSTDA